MAKIGINASFIRKPNTGIGQVTSHFIKQLTRSAEFSDHEIILYLEDDVKLYLPKNFRKKFFLPAWKRDDLIRKIWWEKYSLPKKVREDGCDVLISLYQCPTVFDGKHIMVVHDIIPKLFPEYLNNGRKKYYWNLTEKAIKKAGKIVTISKRTEKDLIQHLGLNAEKITVNYIDVDEIYKQSVSHEKSQKVMKKYGLKQGYIYNGGGLEVRKNTEGVLRAYKMLRDKNKQEHFVQEIPPLVISGKLMPELAPLVADAEKLVKELNLKSHVKLLDFVPQEDLPALYQNATMFVYPSFYEGFGMPVLEAMSQGTPVITSKTSSMPEVGGDSALYCDPNDLKDLMMVMKNILVSQNLHETLAKRGKERSRSFSWKKFTEKVLHIAENL